jgi:tRNA threonylcarbamoyladenosine biosynthesis protein TsaB
MNKLHLDTSNQDKISVRLTRGDEEFAREAARDRKSQASLELIEQLLTESGLKLADLDQLYVKDGPGGSYTGLKVGASIANTLSFVLQIPVNDLPVGELVKPQY